LTHLETKDCFKNGRWVVVIIATLYVIVRAITGNCTTYGNITTTKSGCKLFRGCDAVGSVCTMINHIYLSRGICMTSLGAPTSMLTAGQGGAGQGAERSDACAAPCMRHSADEMGRPG